MLEVGENSPVAYWTGRLMPAAAAVNSEDLLEEALSQWRLGITEEINDGSGRTPGPRGQQLCVL